MPHYTWYRFVVPVRITSRPNMNMLDDESEDNFHGTREGYSYLSDVEWSAVERMTSTVGEEAVWSLLSSNNRDQQHSVIINLIQRELDAARAEVIQLHQKGHQQNELLRQQQSQLLWLRQCVSDDARL